MSAFCEFVARSETFSESCDPSLAEFFARGSKGFRVFTAGCGSESLKSASACSNVLGGMYCPADPSRRLKLGGNSIVSESS